MHQKRLLHQLIWGETVKQFISLPACVFYSVFPLLFYRVLRVI